jgi:hypothetical protein
VGNNRGGQTGRPEAKIKDYSHNNLQKNTELKSISDWKHSEAKGQRKKTLTLCSNLEVVEGDGVIVDEDVDE